MACPRCILLAFWSIFLPKFWWQNKNTLTSKTNKSFSGLIIKNSLFLILFFKKSLVLPLYFVLQLCRIDVPSTTYNVTMHVMMYTIRCGHTPFENFIRFREFYINMYNSNISDFWNIAQYLYYYLPIIIIIIVIRQHI